MNRIIYIDNIRAALMSMGVILHAGITVDFWLPELIGFTSGLFRMKFFFFISGFFVALALTKYTSSTFIQERLRRLGVPALFGILLLNPATCFLIYNIQFEPVSIDTFFSFGFLTSNTLPADLNWHMHIWFLVVLLAFSLMTPFFCRIHDVYPIKSMLNWLTASDKPRERRIWVFAFTVASFVLAARLGHFLTFQQVFGGTGFNFLFQAFLTFFPFYLLGLVAFNRRDVLELFGTVSWSLVIVSATLLAAIVFGREIFVETLGFHLSEAVRHFVESLAGYVICSLVLCGFKTYLNRQNSLVHALVKASYTVFLLHFFFIALLSYTLNQFGVPNMAVYFGSMLGAYILCLAVHFLVVERLDIAALVLNGRPLKPRKTVSVRV